MRFTLTLAIIGCLVAAPAVAQQAAPARGLYVGVFGGGGSSSGTDLTQRGTAFFPEVAGGPLAVNATGQTDSGGVGFVGGQIGYELTYPSMVVPAFEIEGVYLDAGTRRATLQNPTNRLSEQTFDATFPMNSAVFLANMVFSFPTAYPGVTPYIGGGIGAARVAIDGGKSLQTNPSEGDLNHFNSGPDASAWTFAAQVKAGIRVAISRNAYVFGEYRYLYVGSSDQSFGSTVDSAHVPTSPWTVSFDETSHHLGTAGIGFNF